MTEERRIFFGEPAVRHQSISVAIGFGATDWIYQSAIVERQSKLAMSPVPAAERD